MVQGEVITLDDMLDLNDASAIRKVESIIVTLQNFDEFVSICTDVQSARGRVCYIITGKLYCH